MFAFLPLPEYSRARNLKNSLLSSVHLANNHREGKSCQLLFAHEEATAEA